MREVEAAAHLALVEHKIAGEWFNVDADAAIAVVKAEMAKRGIIK